MNRNLILVSLGLSAVALCASLRAQTAPANQTGMSCIERLEIPPNPGIARRARVTGDVEVTARLKPDGSIEAVRSPPPADKSHAGTLGLFHFEVEKALRASRFVASCGTGIVSLTFEFRLKETPELADDYRGVAFRYPNRFEIYASSPNVNSAREPYERSGRGGR